MTTLRADVHVGSFNGLTWTVDSTGVQLNGHQGLDDMAGLRTVDVAKAGDSGEWAGIDYANGRDITLDFMLLGETPDGYAALVEAFKAAMVPQIGIPGLAPPPELALTWGSTPQRQAFVRCRDRQIPYQEPWRTSGPASALFHATDHRIYGLPVHTATVFQGTGGTGLSFPLVFPLAFGGNSSGAVRCQNDGGTATAPLITVHGPATNPAIVNVTTGQTIQMKLTMLATDVLVINPTTHSVMLNGANSRADVDPLSSWWLLLPGANTVEFLADTYDATANVVLTWQDAYL